MSTHPLSKEESKFLSASLGGSDYEVHRLAGDASSRRYFRLIKNESSYVLMQWEPFVDDGNYPFLNIHQHFQKHKVLVPNVISKAPELGLVLLEDLGDLTLERKFWENQNQSMALPFYKQSIDELIKIHYSATADRIPNVVAFKIEFNTEKLLWEMNYGREHLLEKFCKLKLSAKVNDELSQNFYDICRLLDKEPKRICHRDYHSRNIMLKLGKTRIIDFQDARMGPIQYDLVSLVHDSYVDMNDSLRNEVLDYYLARAREVTNSPIPYDEFFSVFRLQMIQRCFKACGSFASFYNMREDSRYLKYLKPTIKKVAQVVQQFPEYSTFYSVMVDQGLLEKNFENPNEVSK